MNLSHKFKRIRLNLARSKEFPEGSAGHGYEFVAPLDAQGHIDPKLWKERREHCRVRRFWNGEDEQTGWLVHKPGGAEHARWVFDYDATRSDDDESGYRLGGHAFVPGEYVSIDHEGDLHTFKVISVEPAA
jgi:hypothetical protein